MKSVTLAHEEDVVAMYREAIKEELRLALHDTVRNGNHQRKNTVVEEATIEETLRHLTERHEKLEREVALLRTIVLRLVSEPLDYN